MEEMSIGGGSVRVIVGAEEEEINAGGGETD